MPLVAVLLSLTLPFTNGSQSPPQASPAKGTSLLVFVYNLQQAVAKDDRAVVAGMARYPLEVTAAGLQIPVADRQAFIGLYDSIVSPLLKDVIRRARVPAAGPKVPGVIVRGDGGIVFENAVTIAPVNGAFRITRLVVPMKPVAKAPGEMAARALTFRVGQPTQVTGTLEPAGIDRYVFHAEQGVFVDARISGVPARTVLLRILDTKTGQAIDARADAGARVWTGRVAAPSDYEIAVVRQPDTGREPLIYTLAVMLK